MASRLPTVKGVSGGAAGALDELGNQIHTSDGKPSFGEDVRPLTRTAPSVDDAALDPAGPCRYELTIGRVHGAH